VDKNHENLAMGIGAAPASLPSSSVREIRRLNLRHRAR